jgi:GntR family transcriptional regulator / MocR family aminotransferase
MLRPWVLRIILHRDSSASVHRQITHAIIAEIRAGRLAPGSALPGSRKLAESLKVNRKTVVQAYDELVAQGWLAADSTRATFVPSQLPNVEPGIRAPRQARPSGKIAEAPDFRLPRRPPALAYLPRADGMLAFDDGLPDTRLMPVETLARAYRRALLEAGRGNRLGYGDPRGSEKLRSAVSTMLNLDRGLSCAPDNICIVRGSQMGIYVAARILTEPGDVAVMEQLSYPPAREAFRAAGAEIATVELDSEGLRLDQLEALCRRKRVRAVYVTPHHQFPTTVVLRPERRLYLMMLAEQFGFAIVEDDYDHEFHFDHRPMLPLASADRGRKVVYIGSMSKVLSPSLRIGYMHAPVPVIDRAAAEVMMIDRQGDPAGEEAVAEMMSAGVIKSHTRKVLRIYAERRALLGALLQDAFGADVEFLLSPGGLALWVHFDSSIDMGKLADAGRRNFVSFLSGSAFAMTDAPVEAARLGFGSMNADELRQAVGRLREARRAI